MDAVSRTPKETAEYIAYTTLAKDSRSTPQLILLALLGGAFIALAAQGSNVAIYAMTSVGLAKTLPGALFATGLILVLLAGAELFTGNMLMIVPLLSGKLSLGRLLRNWGLVYAGNLAGSILIAAFVLFSGQLNLSDGLLGGFTIHLAAGKVGLGFINALFLGILCNILVCMAVWLAGSSTSIGGKILAIFFPIWLFITSGFEHSVANMYYIPAGILAKANSLYVAQALANGSDQAAIDGLNWGSFLINNLIPVTLGNLIGGAVFVGAIFWLAYLRPEKR